MSAVGTAPIAAEAPLDAPYGRLRPARVTAVAAIAAAGAAAVVVSGDVVVHSTGFALFEAYNVIAFAGAALLWLHLRPRSASGPMLLVLAAFLAAQSLQGSASPVVHSLGVLMDPVAVFTAWYLLLAFPRLRLTRPAAAVLGVGVVGVLVGFAPWFFLSPHVAGGTPLARCTAACPSNGLMVLDRPTVAAHFERTDASFVVVFCSLFVALVIARLIRASPPRRRVVAPAYAVGAFWIAALGAFQLARLLSVTDLQLYDTLGWVLTGARVALPLAFVLAFFVARLYAGRALATMLQRVHSHPGAAELERGARDALGDPALQLVLLHGERPVEQRAEGGSERLLRMDGRPVAQLRYDAGLDENPELVDAVATAVQLSLERGEILSDLDRSERRAADAGAAERRRLERNLHDSAQQRLVALRMRMALAQERLAVDPAGAAAEVAGFEQEVDAALDELRALARGAYPPTLREEGIAVALAEVVRLHPRARLRRGASLRRYPDDVEAAVYFSTLEALQNAAKHSGPDAEIVVSVSEEAGELRFEVVDDGRGFDPRDATSAGGLAGVAERLDGFGGALDVRSSPGHGARVSGAVPIRS